MGGYADLSVLEGLPALVLALGVGLLAGIVKDAVKRRIKTKGKEKS